MYQKPMRPDELYHFGVKGMHWGVRRYQNPDGSLTSAGKQRYAVKELKQREKEIAKDRKNAYKHRATLSDEELDSRSKRLQKENQLKQQYEQSQHYQDTWTKQQLKRVGGTIVATLTAGGIAYVRTGKAKAHANKIMSTAIKAIRRH